MKKNYSDFDKGQTKVFNGLINKMNDMIVMFSEMISKATKKMK